MCHPKWGIEFRKDRITYGNNWGIPIVKQQCSV